MATHDYNIANQGFPAFRADLNDALAAIVSNNSNATAPATTFAHMLWVDTAANPSVLKIRNADNDAWVTIGSINQTDDKFKLTPADGVSTDTISELTSAAGVTIDGVLLKDGLVNTLTVGLGAGSVSTNIAVGASALAANTTGSNNTAVGYQALLVNTTGDRNTALGTSALDANTTGARNTAVGISSLGANTTGANNTAVGDQAMGLNTTGSNNIAFGLNALYSNTTGNNNVAMGLEALYANTTGANNTAVGAFALDANTTGANNTAVGYGALGANTTASVNTAVGRLALALNTTGDTNTAMGEGALYNNTTGIKNTAVGVNALGSNTTGSSNLGIGQGGGANITTGEGNICILDYADRGSSARIFNVTTENDRIVMGHNFVTNAYVKVAWTVTSDARDKTSLEPVPHGLSFVEQLNPVSYRWKKSREDDTPKGNRRYGFLAQDILALEGDSPVIIDNETPEHLKYQGEALVPVLVNAIKELKAEVDALKAQINGA